jgi:hypothetical protein
MPTKMRNILPMIWRQVHTPRIPWVPALNAEEQTKLTWAKVIQSYADIPEAYKDFFKPFFEAGQEIPYIVLAPAREGLTRRPTEKLICNIDRETHVLEKSEGTINAQCYPIEAISYVEVKTILLDSHIKISGLTRRGFHASSTIKFNSVTDYLFIPILDGIRHATAGFKTAAQSSETDKFDHLIKLNFKFMNYARRSLLAGEKVIHHILQSEIRAQVLRILGKTFYRTISPTHMSILTDRELIMIREDATQNRVSRYGGIWDYIPLNKIVSLTLREKDADLLVLSIQLPETDRLEYLFQPSAKPELDQLLDLFGKLTTRR